MSDLGGELAVVVLAGGTAARLGGVDKAAVELDGRTLLEWALAALADVGEVVVVGEAVPTSRPVTFTREDPPRGGPVAGLLTGYDALRHRPGALGVLAVDMPRVTAATFRRLAAALPGHDAAFLVDDAGHRQLCGLFDPARLDVLRPDREGQHDMSLRRLLAPFDVAQVPATGQEAHDIDTWRDLRDLS